MNVKYIPLISGLIIIVGILLETMGLHGAWLFSIGVWFVVFICLFILHLYTLRDKSKNR